MQMSSSQYFLLCVTLLEIKEIGLISFLHFTNAKLDFVNLSLVDKSDGNKGFNSSHLIYRPPRLKILLSILFNSMLGHGYNPTELLNSNIISIPKEKASHQ